MCRQYLETPEPESCHPVTANLQAWLQSWRQIQLLLQQERWKEALEQIETLWATLAEQTAPLSSQPWNDLGQALLQICTTHQDLYWQLEPQLLLKSWQAQCLHHLGQTQEAIAILMALSESGPPRALVHHQLSRYLLATGQEEAAIIQLNLALQIDLNYLPAYEDLAFLANSQQAYEMAYRLIQMGLQQGFSPRLLEELVIASAHQEASDFRSLFLELCIQHITPQTLPLLRDLSKSLYLQADYAACEYLSFHLLQEFTEDTELLDLHLLSALHLKHWVPAIRWLKYSLQCHPKQAGSWYRLGIAYSRWEMPLLARHSLNQALSLSESEELRASCLALLEKLPQNRSLDQSLQELLKECLLDANFSQRIQTAAAEALAERGIDWNAELVEQLQKVLTSFHRHA